MRVVRIIISFFLAALLLNLMKYSFFPSGGGIPDILILGCQLSLTAVCYFLSPKAIRYYSALLQKKYDGFILQFQTISKNQQELSQRTNLVREAVVQGMNQIAAALAKGNEQNQKVLMVFEARTNDLLKNAESLLKEMAAVGTKQTMAYQEMRKLLESTGSLLNEMKQAGAKDLEVLKKIEEMALSERKKLSQM